MTRLAIVMIARDEARCIARALESVRPHVDRMIVLDTGSVDDTVAIAAACGAEVHDFVWVDDFAAARNASLALSDADWNLVLDADEVLEGELSALSAGALSAATAPFIGLLRQVNAIDMGGEAGLSSTWIPRLLPRRVRYAGRIHEQPVSAAPQRRLPLELRHDGYLPDSLARKGDRNETLLRLELAAAPDDAYLKFQLGRELQVAGRAAEAADLLCAAAASALDSAFRHSLVMRTLVALKEADRLDEALAMADREFPLWPDSPDFFFVLGDLYMAQASADPDAALAEHLPLVEYAWRRCLDIGERPDLNGAVAGRGGWLAAHNLAVFYEVLGKAEMAGQYKTLSAELKVAPLRGSSREAGEGVSAQTPPFLQDLGASTPPSPSGPPPP
jgi:glycosyltransferase involved in cell wall biosynthesis